MSDNPPGDLKQQVPASIWVLGFVSMLTDISTEMVHSLLPLFLVTTMGASAFTVGLIEGVAESTALMLKVFSGALSDYWGRRKALAVAGYALSAATKPIFPLASSVGVILGARFLDRVGKGVRDAPRDALIVDITPPEVRGAAFGLRQSLDTVGAFVGPLLAVALMLLWANDFRAVFWVAAVPAVLALLLMLLAIKEPPKTIAFLHTNPLSRQQLSALGKPYRWVVVVGGLMGLARFSEAFLILRAFDSGITLALVPLLLVVLNVVYAATAYPFGKWSDRVSAPALLMAGLFVLAVADVCLASGTHWGYVVMGVAFWGLHMGMTQGVMASMIAAAAPQDLRGTAYGFYNLVAGLALLIASGLAGFVWDRWGATYTFYASGVFAGVACLALLGLVLSGSLKPRAGVL